MVMRGFWEISCVENGQICGVLLKSGVFKVIYSGFCGNDVLKTEIIKNECLT